MNQIPPGFHACRDCGDWIKLRHTRCDLCEQVVLDNSIIGWLGRRGGCQTSRQPS